MNSGFCFGSFRDSTFLAGAPVGSAPLYGTAKGRSGKLARVCGDAGCAGKNAMASNIRVLVQFGARPHFSPCKSVI